MNILKQINQEVFDFANKHIQIVPGFTFNQKETLEKIYYYYNSKYTTGDIDDEGNRKYFYNIVRNPCKVFSKSIDFDTKNIRLLTTGGGDPLKTWFMERDLKYWMKDKKFGLVLNKIFNDLPIYGTVVLKIIKGFPYFVDLRNLVVEQSADNLSSSNYIIEVHNYTPAEFRKVAKDMNWSKDKVNETITLFRNMKDVSHIRVFERYGEIDVSETTEPDWQYKRVFWADVGADIYNDRGQLEAEHPGVELGVDDFEGHPYREFHAEKVPGRWLGIGVVETLFEPQIAQNEQTNLQSKTAYWAALRIFQTRDSNFNRNLANDVRNGEVLNVDSEVTQVDMTDRNLAFFNQQFQKWMANRDELSFSYDVVQGERLPAGTPLGSAKIAISQTLSYFEGIQETVALELKDMLYHVIIPRFSQENTTKHTLRLVGQDLEQFVAMVKNELILKEVIRLAVKNKLPTFEEKEAIGLAIEASIKQGKEKLLEIPKDYYKDVKYDVEIDITGESIDTRVTSATKFALLQAITTDPTVTQDPIKRKILFSMAEDGGVNANDLFGVEESKVPMPEGRAGGGVSAPALQGMIPGESENTF